MFHNFQVDQINTGNSLKLLRVVSSGFAKKKTESSNFNNLACIFVLVFKFWLMLFWLNECFKFWILLFFVLFTTLKSCCSLSVSPVRAFIPSYVNWLYAFLMTNFISNTLPQISDTTPYLARKKVHLYYTYLFSARKYKISLPGSSKSSSWPWVSWDWCASWVHQYLYKVFATHE